MDKDNCTRVTKAHKDEMIRLALLEVRLKVVEAEINKMGATQDKICKILLKIEWTFYGAIGLYVLTEGTVGDLLIGIRTFLT